MEAGKGGMHDGRILSYGRQSIDAEDVASVAEALRSDYLTTGPRIAEFERAVADFVGARHAVAVNSGTAALHAAMHALDIGPGDEVIVPAMTFAATANCVVFQGGTPVFADVDPETLLLDPAKAASKVTPRTKAVIGVDYAGHPCDWDSLRTVADRAGAALVADGCHSLGAEYHGRMVGSVAAMTAFSFHPVKPITTGEGGMITTDDAALEARLRPFRNHGITTDHRQREQQGAWFYEMADIGFNYRITDFQCVLGMRQLSRLPTFLDRRSAIAARYDAAFRDIPGIAPLAVRPGMRHGWHLYVVRIDPAGYGMDRNALFTALRGKGIHPNVHYVPVHLHPFYRKRFGTGPGLCPVAEAAYGRILSLPIFPDMTVADADRVIGTLAGLAAKAGVR